MALGTRGSGTIIPYHCANSVPSPFAAAFRREKNSSKKTLLFFLPSAVANPRLGMIFVPIIEDKRDKISAAGGVFETRVYSKTKMPPSGGSES